MKRPRKARQRYAGPDHQPTFKESASMATADCKTCPGCKLPLPNSDFSPDRRALDGLQPKCRACTNVARRRRYVENIEAKRQKRNAYFKENRAAVLASNARSRLKNADKIKEMKRRAYLRDREKPEFKAQQVAYIAANKDRKREYDKVYRAERHELMSARAAAWVARNPEKRRSVLQNYNHKRRAIEKTGMSSAELHEWKNAQPKVCYWCGKKCAKNATVDHYEPLSKGGKHEASNLVIACRPCNVRKNAKDPEQFRAESWPGSLFSGLIT